MNLDLEQLLFASILVTAVCLLSFFTPHEYQFCTGACTGNLSNCFCGIIPWYGFQDFFTWFPVLVGSAYYYLKIKPTFLTLLAVIVVLIMVMLVASILGFEVAVWLSAAH